MLESLSVLSTANADKVCTGILEARKDSLNHFPTSFYFGLDILREIELSASVSPI